MQATRPKSEEKLDKALEQTFPASDPATPDVITGTEKPGSDIKRKPPEISRQDVEAAAQKTIECPTCHGIGRIAAPTQ
jgi:hypothetical protein